MIKSRLFFTTFYMKYNFNLYIFWICILHARTHNIIFAKNTCILRKLRPAHIFCGAGIPPAPHL